MNARRLAVLAVAVGAAAGPIAFGVSEPSAAAAPVSTPGAGAAATSEPPAIILDVEPNGSLAATLTWSGGTGPYDVLIDPHSGEGRYETGIDDTSITVAAEPSRGYCYEVFGSDGSASGRECHRAAVSPVALMSRLMHRRVASAPRQPRQAATAWAES